MNSQVKKWVQYALFMSIGGILLYLTFATLNPTELWANIRNTHLGGLLLALGIGFLAIIIRGVRWVQLVESMEYQVSAPRAIAAVAFSYLVNLVTPRVGEVARCTALNRTDQIPIDKLVGTVVLERVVDTLMFGLVFLVTLVTQADLLRVFLNQSGAELPELGLTFLLWVIGALIGGAILVWKTKFVWEKWALAQKILGFVDGLWFGLKSLRTVKNKPLFWLYSLSIWACYVGTIVIGFQIVPGLDSLGVQEAFFISVAAALGFVIPVPGGIGAYHFLVSKALFVLGFELTLGTAFATVIHSGQSLMFVVTGALGFVFLYFAGRKTTLE